MSTSKIKESIGDRAVQLTLSPEVFPASPSLDLGSEQAQKMIAISGRKCYELYERFIHAGSSVKMLTASLLGTEAWYSNLYSLNWLVRDTKRNVLLFQLQPSRRHTGETESGSWPTPTASDHRRGSEKNIGGRRKNGYRIQTTLTDAVRKWPTPTVSMSRGATMTPRKDGRKRDDRLDYAVAQVEGLHNGQLNPEWVEWLMGYPLGWTELSPSEMRSSRKSRRK